MILRWILSFSLHLSLSALPAFAIEVPPEYLRFIISRPELQKSYTRKLCERFDLCQAVGFDKSIALVIGVSKYQELGELQSTAKDAERVKDFLFNSSEFDEIIYLTEADATKERIEYFMDDYIPSVLSDTNSRTRFLFYFSGHGATRTGDEERGYLMLADNKKGSFFRSIGMDTIAAWANYNTRNAVHSLFIIDACLSGIVGREIKQSTFSAKRDPRDLMKYPAGVVLTAGTVAQPVSAGKEWGAVCSHQPCYTASARGLRNDNRPTASLQLVNCTIMLRASLPTKRGALRLQSVSR
jgi:hypothetical protein